MNKTNILEMARGAIMEQIDIEVAKVIDNIIDLNTEPKKKRTLTVTVDFIPSADRQQVNIVANAKSKLLPNNAIETSLYVAPDSGTGEPLVVEMTPQIPGQLGVGGGEQNENKILRMVH